MKKVRLLGELGKRFKKVIKLDVKTPAEAVRALCVNFPEFKKFVIESEKHNIGYRVIVGRKDRGVDELHDPVGQSDIKIVPVLMGAGGRFGQIIVGSILIATGFVLDLAFQGNPFSTYFYQAGIAMIVGGVVQLLTPLPDVPDDNEPDNKPSYIFNGAVNTSAQGYPVPVGYGRMIVGSAIVSAGIDTDDIPV